MEQGNGSDSNDRRRKQRIRIRYRERIKIKDRPRGYALKRYLRKNLRNAILVAIFSVTAIVLIVVVWQQIKEGKKSHRKYIKEVNSGWHGTF